MVFWILVNNQCEYFITFELGTLEKCLHTMILYSNIKKCSYDHRRLYFQRN